MNTHRFINKYWIGSINCWFTSCHEYCECPAVNRKTKANILKHPNILNCEERRIRFLFILHFSTLRIIKSNYFLHKTLCNTIYEKAFRQFTNHTLFLTFNSFKIPHMNLLSHNVGPDQKNSILWDRSQKLNFNIK